MRGRATEVASPVGVGRGREGSVVGSGVELGVMMQGVGRRGGERVGGVDRVQVQVLMLMMLLMHRGQPPVFLLLLVLIGQVTMLGTQHRPIALPQGELPALPQTD